MFSDERIVHIQVKGNGSIEEFVLETDIKDDGFVSVRIVKREDGIWAELPTPYRKMIPVDDGQLVPA